MKILLSAFAFAPNQGSEPGVGWRWAVELAKHHQVVVITDATRRPLVEAPGVDLPANLTVVYFRPRWLRRLPLDSRTAQTLYVLWQFGLLRFARQLHHREYFDLAIHITYGVFRHPSFLGCLGIPFIFGPLGGGEDAPLALKRSISGTEMLKELLRSLINKVALVDPFLWFALHKSTLILTKTADTKNSLPWPFRKRAIVYPEIGIDVAAEAAPCIRKPSEPLQVLFAGRLLGWKGAHLAIRAVALASARGVSIEFTILGSGPFEPELRRIKNSVDTKGVIKFIGKVSQPELFQLYRHMHCFLFPSLHDSSGNVVLEAQANGLPVICLDLGGPGTLVNQSTAFIIKTAGQSEDDVVESICEALTEIANNDESRIAMGMAAIKHTRENFSWEKRVTGVLELVKKINQ